MYANKRNVLELLALMLKFGIRHIVVCPGSRNAPLSQSFATDGRFTCYSITDERSAAFFALGLTQALKEPVAVCCTSGSALLNVLPAVSEAYYQQLPLLVISADRPAEWIGQMDGQPIPQANMGDAIFKKSVHLPEIKDDAELWHCNRLVNEALLALTHRTNGPAHINIPLSEPLFDFSATELPDARKIERYENADSKFSLPQQLIRQWDRAKRPLIIIGQQPLEKDIHLIINKLSAKNKCLIFAEQIGNIQCAENIISNFDAILYAFSDKEELKPDLVVYLGGHIVSKRLKSFIRNNRPENVWRIALDGEATDTFKCLTTVVEALPLPVLQALQRTEKIFPECYTDNWKTLSDKIKKRLASYPFSAFSDIYVMKKTMEQLPACALQLGNSSIVRNAQLFPLRNAKEVFCNRGTSGIEGSMSTAVGFSAGYSGLTYLIIGDLSFFYDMNALWNEYVSGKLRILVINNGNGQIFNTLPGLAKSEIRGKFIAATHHASVRAWVEDRGFIYLSANDQQELEDALSLFCNPQENKPLVLEVFTDAKVSEDDLKRYITSPSPSQGGEL